MDDQIDHMIMEFLMKPVSAGNLSSSSSSDDDEDSDEEYLLMMYNNHRIQNFVEKIVPSYTDFDYKSYFRMDRSTAQTIIQRLDCITSKIKSGWPKVTAEKAFMVTVWYLSNQDTFRQISERFNVAESCAHRIIRKVTTYLAELSSEFIVWPTKTKMKSISSGFQSRAGLKRVIGAIDARHISIKKSANYSDDYINRKNYCSIIMQGVVDNDLKFTNLYVGEPGLTLDAKVLKHSSLYEMLQDGTSMNLDGYFLVGDASYPSLNWLVPPYKDNRYLNKNKKEFNCLHSAARVVVDNAFALLKGRFRRLNHFDNSDLDLIVNCVISACVLHNICQELNDVGEQFIEKPVTEMGYPDENIVLMLNNRVSRREIVYKQLFPHD